MLDINTLQTNKIPISIYKKWVNTNLTMETIYIRVRGINTRNIRINRIVKSNDYWKLRLDDRADSIELKDKGYIVKNGYIYIGKTRLFRDIDLMV